MARALWKGAISFSLVHIPVTLTTASRPGTIDLDMLDKRDFSPIGYQRYNKTTGKVVEWGEIVKGFQYEKGEYVVLTDEDFRRANVKATQTIDIVQFVEREEIPTYYFDTPYHVIPDKRAAKVYALLRDALEKSGKIAVATVVIRTRQAMAALVPLEGLIMMNTLRYADEIVSPADAMDEPPARAQVSGKELQMAMKLIDEMSEKWQPDKFHDTYRDDLMKRIEEKVREGQTKQLTAPSGDKAPREGGKVVDLMSLLSRSLAERGGGDDEAKPRRTRRPVRRTKRARAARRA